MKKLISALLILTMLASVICVSASAATVYVDVDFKSEEQFLQNFIPGAFFVEDGKLYGYDEARALQSNYEASEETYKWLTYDSAVTIALADDDMSVNQRVVSLVYCNDNMLEYGLADGGVYMSFVYDVDEGCFRLATGLHGSYGTAESDRLEIMPPVYKEIVDTDMGEEFFTLGMSVDKDRIRCFYNDEIIYDFVDTAREWVIADLVTSPFVFWQNGNYIQFSNVTIAEAGYLYPYAADEGTNTPVDPETPADPEKPADPETPADPEKPADPENPADPETPADPDAGNAGNNNTGNNAGNAGGNENAGNAGNNAGNAGNSGNNAGNNKPADTNTNKPAGGNATATGDATFAVVAAMVASLGCAVIVKKASAR